MLDEKYLIDLFLQRKEEAIEKSAEQFGSYCLRVAENILKDASDAEECLNTTWLKVWNSIPPTVPLSLRQYLAGVTRNTAFQMYRQNHAQKRGGGNMELVLEELEECIGGGSDAEAEYIASELRAAVSRFVRSLPRLERSIFVRRYYFADPSRKIAEDFGLTENHVNVMLHRTRRKLRKALKDEGFCDE